MQTIFKLWQNKYIPGQLKVHYGGKHNTGAVMTSKQAVPESTHAKIISRDEKRDPNDLVSDSVAWAYTAPNTTSIYTPPLSTVTWFTRAPSAVLPASAALLPPKANLNQTLAGADFLVIVVAAATNGGSVPTLIACTRRVVAADTGSSPAWVHASHPVLDVGFSTRRTPRSRAPIQAFQFAYGCARVAAPGSTARL